MLRLLKWTLVLGAIAAVVCFVPVGGRTVRDRWRAAKSPWEFVERAWREVRSAAGEKIPAPKVQRKPGALPEAQRRAAAPRAQRAPEPGEPLGQPTEADRKELDRILADRLH